MPAPNAEGVQHVSPGRRPGEQGNRAAKALSGHDQVPGQTRDLSNASFRVPCLPAPAGRHACMYDYYACLRRITVESMAPQEPENQGLTEHSSPRSVPPLSGLGIPPAVQRRTELPGAIRPGLTCLTPSASGSGCSLRTSARTGSNGVNAKYTFYAQFSTSFPIAWIHRSLTVGLPI